MQIDTKFHGAIEIDTAEFWMFPKGLPGFEDEKEFALLPIEGNDILQVLQSTKQSQIAFIVANPYTLVENYSFDMDEPTIDQLDITRPEDLFFLNIMTIKQPFNGSTINLQAPLVFHMPNRKAKQMTLNNNSFLTRHPLGQLKEAE